MKTKLLHLTTSILLIVAFFMLMSVLGTKVFYHLVSPMAASFLAQISAAVIAGAVAHLLQRKELLPETSIDTGRIYPFFLLNAFAFKVAAVCLVQTVLVLIFCFIDEMTLVTGNMGNFAEAGLMEAILLIVSAGVAAPVIEEALFRGFLFGSLRKAIGVPAAIVLSGLIFGLIHMNSVATVLLTAVAGMIFAYIYEITGNLINSMLVHSAFNLAMIFKLLVKGGNVEVTGLVLLNENLMLIVAIVVVVFCAIFSLITLRNMKRELHRCRLLEQVRKWKVEV